MEALNKYIDHTLLKPTATEEQIANLCQEAIENEFATVCVNPVHVKFAKSLLEASPVGVCTVIGFPLGANLSGVKSFEARIAIDHGANEVDMVINLGLIKQGDWKGVQSDISDVVEAASGRTVKVILETCLLNDEEIRKACEACLAAKAHFVKTSTGFSTGGATLEAVKIMKELVGNQCLIKASGGIRDYQTALNFIQAGANRLGTSSSVEIVKGTQGKEDY